MKLGFGFGNESMCVNETEAGGKVNTEGETEEFKYLGSKATDSTREVKRSGWRRVPFIVTG